MGELRKLQLFYAQHNDIEQLPDFEGCECIQEVYFGNNYIKASYKTLFNSHVLIMFNFTGIPERILRIYAAFKGFGASGQSNNQRAR